MIDIYRQCCFNRFFEERVAYAIKEKHITCPTYLSVGGEYIPVLLKHALEKLKVGKVNIFAQHRCHSYYLTFIQKPLELALELCGLKSGCNQGYGGSASISGQNGKYKMWGHDGLLGSQIPIGVGHTFASKELSIIIIGDGAFEEDWVFGTLAFCAYHRCPCLFIVENNNLSITTPVTDRRNWDICNFAKTLGIVSRKALKILEIELDSLENDLEFVRAGCPRLVEYNIERHYWHVGSGKDGNPKNDYIDTFSKDHSIQAAQFKLVDDIWKQVGIQLSS